MASRSRSRSPAVDPLLDTPEFLLLARQAQRRSSDGSVETLGCTRGEILQYTDAMMTNYPTNAAHLLATCRLLRGMLAQEIREAPTPQDEIAEVPPQDKVPTPQGETTEASNAAGRRRVDDCDHDYRAEKPLCPRDNGEQYEVCRKCGAQR